MLHETAADPIAYFGEDVPTLLLDEKTGAYYVNPEKTKIKWWWGTAQVAGQFPFALGANARQEFRIRINPEVGLLGDTEITALMVNSTGRFACNIFVPDLDKNLANGLIPSSLMFGTAQLQALLAQTIYAIPSFDITMDALDTSGSANTISAVPFGRRFLAAKDTKSQAERRSAGMSRFMHAYWLGPTTAFDNTAGSQINLNLPQVSIPAGHSVTVTYTVPSDAYFDCRYVLDDSTSSTGIEISDLLAVIREGSGGRSLIDAPTGSNGLSWRNLIASPTVTVAGMPNGTTVRAASLPSPADGNTHLFAPGTDIEVTFTSTDAGTITLRTAFAGLAIYRDTPPEACS